MLMKSSKWTKGACLFLPVGDVDLLLLPGHHQGVSKLFTHHPAVKPAGTAVFRVTDG